MRGKMDCFGMSDIGRVRDSNQDQFLIADLRKSIVMHHCSLGYDNHTELSGGSRAKLMIVADGMGGHAGGQRASWMAVEGIVQYLLTSLHWPINCEPDHEKDFFRGLHEALKYSQDQIRAVAESRPTQEHMGTTLTLAWIVWPNVYLIHVGDSRAYLCRNNRLQLLSHDQTVAQAMIDQGLVDPNGGTARRFSNILTSALGCTSNMEPLYGRLTLEPEDKLLMCSDGLTKHVSDVEIENVLSTVDSSKAGCERLVDAANNAGGVDNITVVLARFTTQVVDPEEQDQTMADVQVDQEYDRSMV